MDTKMVNQFTATELEALARVEFFAQEMAQLRDHLDDITEEVFGEDWRELANEVAHA